MAFNAWYQPNKNTERFVFVGCVHKTDDNILSRLAQVAANPPDYLIFTGDVTGSDELEEAKRLFYNSVYNRARRELGIGTDADKNLSDTQLLRYIGADPPYPYCTLKDGYIELMAYRFLLEGYSIAGAREMAALLQDSEIAKGIREIGHMTYFGCDWHLHLPQVVREATNNGIETSANRLLETLQPILAAGTEVIMVAGNWDNVENNQKGNWGADIEVFDTIPFFRQNGVIFHDQIDCLITNKTVLVFLPYWELVKYISGWGERTAHVVTEANIHRHSKTIIAVVHGAPSWQVHNPNALAGPTEKDDDRKIVLDRLGELLAMIKPDEVIHGHEHNPLKDAEGNLLPHNTHYVLEIGNDTINLVDNPSYFSQCAQIIGTYIPFQGIATLDIPLECDPHPHIFNGNRDPAFIH